MFGFDPSCYEPSYLLLKEARESWDYAVSDEVVDVLNDFEATRDTFHAISKDYLEGEAWIEFYLTLELNRKAQYCGIIEAFDGDRVSGRNGKQVFKGNIDGARRNTTMLVNNTELLQYPQHVQSNSGTIRSVVRLKRLDDGSGLFGNVFGLLGEAPSACVVPTIDNGKLGLNRISNVQLGEGEHKLIQGGSQTIGQIAQDERYFSRNLAQLDADAVARSIRIIFAQDGIRLSLPIALDFQTKAFEMVFRPSCFQIGIY